MLNFLTSTGKWLFCRVKFVAICGLLVFTTGCSTNNVIRNEQLNMAPVAAKPTKAIAQEQNSSGIDYITTDGGMLQILDAEPAGDPLPSVRLENISLSNASTYEIMRALLWGTNISFNVVNDSPDGDAHASGISAVNISGSLSDVLDQLSRTAGFYYFYRQGILTIRPDRQYVVDLPPIDDMMESMSGMVKHLGATDVMLDRPGKLLSFRASRSVFERISSYINHIRNTRSLIVYDSIIWEVVLSDGSQQGVAWNKFQWRNPQTGTTYGITSDAALTGAAQALPIAGGIGFSAIFNGGRVAIDILASFLETQGALRTVSQPKLSMVAGGKASWRVGNSTTYVSKVGTTTGTSISQTTVETAQLLTGLDLLINGDVYDGTIFTDIRLRLNDLLRFAPYSALGTQLSLPQTANRDLETLVRARPGDTIMLAGINIDRSSNDAAGMFGKETIAIPTSVSASKNRSELIVVLQPRLIRFASKSDMAARLDAQSKRDAIEKALSMKTQAEELAIEKTPVAIAVNNEIVKTQPEVPAVEKASIVDDKTPVADNKTKDAGENAQEIGQ